MREITFLTILVVGVVLRPAFAQNSGSAQSAGAAVEESGLADVVVTAQRREEKLQNVPIAVTAITGDALQQVGIADSQQLTQVVPNLTFTHSSFAFQPTLRGIGTRSIGVGDESNVATYIDGVYIPDMTGTSVELLDVQRVEVLRGPQGTLFGRNATGGLINVITEDPTFNPRGELTVGYGSYDRRSAGGKLSGGLTSTLAASFSFNVSDEDGYIHDILRGGRISGDREAAGHLKLLFVPTDRIKIVGSIIADSSSNPSVVAYRPLNGNAKPTPLPSALGTYEASDDTAPGLKRTSLVASLSTAFDLGAVSLQTTTSYSPNRSHLTSDSDATPVNIAFNDIAANSQSATQEIRLVSAPGGRLEWVAGVFGFYDLSRFDPLLLKSTLTGPTGTVRLNNRTESGAAFGEGTYHFTEALGVTAGFRYSYEDRRFNLSSNGSPVISDDTVSGGQSTPRVILNYRFAANALAYASYSRGYKSAIFNGTGAAQKDPVRPETLDSYEVGLKSDPTSWLRVNLASFYYKYHDIQFSARNAAGTSVLLNAAQSTIKGIEAETAWAPLPGLTINLSGAYLDAKYDSFLNSVIYTPNPPAIGGNVLSSASLFGTDMIRAPKATVTLSPTYRHAFAQGTLDVGGNFYHSAKYFWDPQNRLYQPAYNELSAQMGWTLPKDHWRIAVWGRNLTSAKIAEHILPSALADEVVYEAPITYGVTVTGSF